MEASFAPNWRDYAALYRFKNGLREGFWKISLLIASVPLLIFCTAALILRFPLLAFVGVSTAVGVYFAPFLPEVAIRLQPKRHYPGNVFVSFSLTGVVIKIGIHRVHQNWEQLLDLHVDDRGVYFRGSVSGYFFVPARAFGETDFKEKIRHFHNKTFLE